MRAHIFNKIDAIPAGLAYGPKFLTEFLNKNNLKCLKISLRAHIFNKITQFPAGITGNRT